MRLQDAADDVGEDAAESGVRGGAQGAGAERPAGLLRVDTVHLGDKDGRKGVYVVKRRTIAHKSADT